MSLSDEDELFSSLARELLADLQVDDGQDAGWLSLDQLEQELAQLDAAGPSRFGSSTSELPAPPVSAASLVLSHAPQNSSDPAAAPGTDAWSMSLQRFTASALEQDFLSADAARKTTTVTSPPPPTLDLSNAQDYNLAELPQKLPPPPGIPSDPSQQLLCDAASKLVQGLGRLGESEQQPAPTASSSASYQRQPSMHQMELPQPQTFPKTPQNSMYFDNSMGSSPSAPTPPPSVEPTPAAQRNIHQAAPNQPPPTMAVPVGVPLTGAPGQRGWQQLPQPQNHQQHMMMGHAHPQQQHQQPPRMMPASMPRIFCNSHPRAPPIPAQQLASKYMNARDVSYVIHSLLKPLLTIPADADADYQLQLLRRTGQPNQQQQQSQGNDYKNKVDILEQLASRQKKAQEWSSGKHTLGHITKTNALRPRSLIAPFVAASSTDNDSSNNKQRASLWKARIYCDQAHQAYASVVECWRMAAPGQVPISVQAHLQRLLKCFGIVSATEVDPAAMVLMLKLRKGRVLVARVLEQALVPPVAVQTLLPVVLGALMANSPLKDDILSDDRLSMALARVIATLPELTEDALVESARAVLQNGSVALSSESRMHCVHALLQRGSASQTEEWNQGEAEFMKLLVGM